MKYIFAVLIVLSQSSVSVAGQYSDESDKQRTCERFAKGIVGEYNKMRKQGFEGALTAVNKCNKNLAEVKAEMNATNPSDSDYEARNAKVKYKFFVTDTKCNMTDAHDAQEAYMGAWSRCIDYYSEN